MSEEEKTLEVNSERPEGFFTKLGAKMEDKQIAYIQVTKVSGKLALLVVPDKKTGRAINATGDPVECDIEFWDLFQKASEKDKSKFSATITEGAGKTKSEKEERNIPAGSEEGRALAKAAKKKKASQPAKKQPAKKKAAAKKAAKKTTTVKKNVKPVSISPIKEDKPETPEVKTSAESTGPSKESQFKELMALGKKEYEGRRYAEARDAYKSALDLFPDNAQAIKDHLNADKWVRAIENMNKK